MGLLYGRKIGDCSGSSDGSFNDSFLDITWRLVYVLLPLVVLSRAFSREALTIPRILVGYCTGLLGGGGRLARPVTLLWAVVWARLCGYSFCE